VEHFGHAFDEAFCAKIRDMKIQLYELHFPFLLDNGHYIITESRHIKLVVMRGYKIVET
jgi:hypothetical protein